MTCDVQGVKVTGVIFIVWLMICYYAVLNNTKVFIHQYSQKVRMIFILLNHWLEFMVYDGNN